MIKSFLDRMEVDMKLGFVCQDIKQFKLFLDTCESEGIIFSKLDENYIESYDILFPTYTAHLNKKYNSVALIIKKGNEYQFYSRDYKNPKDNYPDENEIVYVHFTQILRNEKLKELGL